ncbi:MAG: hypothetical protein QXI58_02710 [Candidatus Micrarchaeia archaeon]
MPTININTPPWDFEERIYEVKPGNFIGSHNVIVCAGPPKLVTNQDKAITFYPIGLNETFTIQQVKELQRLTEIGSKQAYFVLGRTLIRVQMASLILDVGNILKALYKYYISNNSIGQTPLVSPHSGEIYLNLASDFFDQPIGLLLWIKNNRKEDIAQYFLEECYVSAHNFNLTAGGLVLAEGVIIETYKLQPLEIKKTVEVPQISVAE